MRHLIVVLIFTTFQIECFSQWQQAYPFTNEIYDVSVPEVGWVFLLSTKNYQSVIYKSSDGAKTWRVSNPVTQEPTHTLVFTDSLSGFTASSRAVYRTNDGAQTWTSFLLPTGLADPQMMIFPTKTTGYIIYSSGRIVKTTDGGDTWTVLEDTPQSSSDLEKFISFSDEIHGYIVVDQKIYKTIDGGDSWTPIMLAQNVNNVYAVSPDIAFASTGYETYRTTDAGITWTRIYYNSSTLMHFLSESNGLFFSLYGAVQKTTDGGNNIVGTYQSDFPIYWYNVDFSGNFGCAIGSDYAIITTTDGGSTWNLNNTKPQHGTFNGVHFTSESEGFMISESAGFLRTSDNAKSWYYPEDYIVRNDLVQMAFVDADTGIFVVTNNYAYWTYDGGKTMFSNDWSVPIIGHLSSRDYEMVNSKIIYTVGARGKAAKSVDGGKSWTPFTLDFLNDLYTIKCIDAKTCHSAGIAGMIISTWDGGEHWKVHNLSVNNDLKSMVLLNATTGFIGGAQGTILRTNDGGQSWSFTDTGAIWPVISFEFLTDLKGYAITEGGEILRTNDGGLQWVLKDTERLPNQYTVLKTTFMRDTTHIFGMSDDYVYRWTNPPPIPEVITDVEESPATSGVRVYPNPSQGILNFNHADPIESVVVTDMKGSMIKQVTGDILHVSIQDCEPGLYIVMIRQRSGTRIHRIIKR